MKNFYPGKGSYIFKICLLIMILAAVIYGCRKDVSKITDVPVLNAADPKVAAAKSWYESNFPKNKQKPASQTTNSADDSSFDLSRFFNPDWNQAKNYTRYDDDVIEMPVDSASKIGLKIGSSESSQYNSRSSVLILKRSEKYYAYVMTIVGDVEYINGDKSKLSKNTYTKRDVNFSGLVYYTTPQGGFVSGYFYKNGSITNEIIKNRLPVANGGSVTQSVGKKVNLQQVCFEWYYCVDATVDGIPLPTICNYGGQKCYDVPTTDTGPDAPPTGGGDGSGSGGSTNPPANPNPCDVQNVSSVKDGKVINAIQIRKLPGDDGGFPPLPPPDEDPCCHWWTTHVIK